LKIAVTGASGFVGRHLVKELAGRGHDLRLLSYKRRPQIAVGSSAEVVEANVHNSDSLSKAFKHIDVVYHLVGIIAETRRLTFEKTVVAGTQNVIAACKQKGVKRLIYLSAAGASSDAASKYHRTKWQTEKAVRESGIDYTIFRPSVIYGEGDGFISMLVKMIKRLPLVPVIGDGKYKLQPVFIRDLIAVMAEVPGNRQSVNKTIEIGGPEALEYRKIISTLKRVLNKKRGRLYLPLWLMKANAAILEKIMKPAPITRDQLLMLEAGNITDNSLLTQIFDVELTKFENALNEYMR